MKEEYNENALTMEESQKRDTDIITLSSPNEEIQKEYMKLKKKECRKKSKKFSFFIIILLFIALGVYPIILAKQGYAYMKKTKKSQDNIYNKKKIDSKVGPLNKDKGAKTKKVEKYKKRNKKI